MLKKTYRRKCKVCQKWFNTTSPNQKYHKGECARYAAKCRDKKYHEANKKRANAKCPFCGKPHFTAKGGSHKAHPNCKRNIQNRFYDWLGQEAIY